MEKLKNIACEFQIPCAINQIQEFGHGHINSTYKVSLTNNANEYILQKINHNIFKDVEMLQNNIQRIIQHIRAKLEARGETDIQRKTLTIIPTHDNKLYYFDGTNYWRMMLLIANSFTYEAVTPEYSATAGEAFADFQQMLSDLPGEPLGETIPDFHNMEFRLQQFSEALALDPVNRAENVRELIEAIHQRASDMVICQELYRKGVLPKRINHCDTKVNNMLFDENGKVLCVIDLDTTMPGFVVSDIGDFMRTAGNTGLEDDTNLDKIQFNMDIFKAYTGAYIKVARNFLSEMEIDLLAFGAKLMTYMQLTRFLTDYINGDTYYKIQYPEHNLQRSKAQYKLLISIEENFDEMQAFVNSHKK